MQDSENLDRIASQSVWWRVTIGGGNSKPESDRGSTTRGNELIGLDASSPGVPGKRDSCIVWEFDGGTRSERTLGASSSEGLSGTCTDWVCSIDCLSSCLEKKVSAEIRSATGLSKVEDDQICPLVWGSRGALTETFSNWMSNAEFWSLASMVANLSKNSLRCELKERVRLDNASMICANEEDPSGSVSSSSWEDFCAFFDGMLCVTRNNQRIPRRKS